MFCRQGVAVVFAVLLLAPVAEQTHTEKHVSFWSEYLGIGPPLFPAEAGEPTTCYKYIQSLTDTTCNVHVSEELPVKLHNCALTSTSGVLILERTDASGLQAGELSGTAIYRLRITGPEGLWLLELAYCRPDLALATYALKLPGRYSAEVLMLYTSFSFVKPNSSKALSEPWAGYLTLDVPAASAPDGDTTSSQAWTPAPDESILTHPYGTYSTTDQQHQMADALLPLCADTGPLPGRWHFRDWPPAGAGPLLRTCIWGNLFDDCAVPERRGFRFDSHPATLRWQPHGCRMRSISGLPATSASPSFDAGVDQTTNDDYSWRTGQQQQQASRGAVHPDTCLPPGRRVCFVGDSHMRYLHNSLVLWQGGYRTTVNNTAKELLVSTANSSRYSYMLWGHDWPQPTNGEAGADPLAANCTDVVANFGQWPASYRSGPAPYSAAQYLRQLLHVRRKMLGLRQSHGVRVFWVTTGMSSLKARLEAAGIDWRTDPLLLLYNRLAADVMSGAIIDSLKSAPTPMVAAAAAGGAGRRRGASDVSSRSGGDGTGTGTGVAPLGDVVAGASASAAGREMEMEDEKEQERAIGEAAAAAGAAAAASLGGVASWSPNSAEQPSLEGGRVAEQPGWRRRRRDPQRHAIPQKHLQQQQPQPVREEQDQQLRPWLQRLLKRQGRLLRWELQQLETSAAASAAIPLIDTWSATRVLHDTTWDGVHYTNLGAVGLAQLTAVLHALCSEAGLAAVGAG